MNVYAPTSSFKSCCLVQFLWKFLCSEFCFSWRTVMVRKYVYFSDIAQWLAIVLRRHFQFPIPLGIDLICLYSPKLIAEFEFCAKKAISGSYGVENSQTFLKIAKEFLKIPKFAKNLVLCCFSCVRTCNKTKYLTFSAVPVIGNHPKLFQKQKKSQ